ncbi:hypothetical protein [Bacillus seohaeanensis]|uniref:Uncharacterized protein n=1 Tax=Bacillus seohaeanensis TaxID=284580 RepID=A0ABW5RXD5_9BACI
MSDWNEQAAPNNNIPSKTLRSSKANSNNKVEQRKSKIDKQK